ncbi:hypothetical protein [Sphingopyxis yananensis]|nr:hypothetical protein [Sphingopyxis yananensis]
MSINDHPDVREIFAGFDQEEVRCRYTVGGAANAKDTGELVIR